MSAAGGRRWNGKRGTANGTANGNGKRDRTQWNGKRDRNKRYGPPPQYAGQRPRFPLSLPILTYIEYLACISRQRGGKMSGCCTLFGNRIIPPTIATGDDRVRQNVATKRCKSLQTAKTLVTLAGRAGGKNATNE